MKKLSFCITCKNRFHQISKTLPYNLRDNKDNQNDIEFVLLDFKSTDGLEDWIVDNFKEELKSGYLRYILSDELPNWHTSVAKNIAHKHASGDILVNLDADNYTGRSGGMFIIKQFEKHGDSLLLHQFSGEYGDGSCGRIGVLKYHFDKIGGYDESLFAVGADDIDLIGRLAMYGLFYFNERNEEYNDAIKNTKDESMKYAKSNISYDSMNRINTYISRYNIARKELIANTIPSIFHMKGKKNKVQVSVVMTSYNSSEYIKKSINSILQQTFKDFELIVIDRGSTDITLPVLHSFKDERIKIISNPSFDLFDYKSIESVKAQGVYICIVNPEDTYTRNFLLKQFCYLQKYRNIGATTTNMLIVDKEDKPIKSALNFSSKDMYLNPALFNERRLYCKTLMVRSRLLKKYRITFEKKQTFQAYYDFLLKCADFFPIERLDDLLLLSRERFEQFTENEFKIE